MTRFSRKYPSARKPLARFLALVQSAQWKHFPEVKETFPATDYAASTGTLIFDIGGNNYRLITRLRYRVHKVYIVDVLTHTEYDQDSWKDKCQCL